MTPHARPVPLRPPTRAGVLALTALGAVFAGAADAGAAWRTLNATYHANPDTVQVCRDGLRLEYAAVEPDPDPGTPTFRRPRLEATVPVPPAAAPEAPPAGRVGVLAEGVLPRIEPPAVVTSSAAPDGTPQEVRLRYRAWVTVPFDGDLSVGTPVAVWHYEFGAPSAVLGGGGYAAPPVTGCRLVPVDPPDPPDPPPPPAEPVLCDGRRATITGTPGPDDLTGTAGPDVVAAGAGPDRIRALGGDDVICAGPGNDRVAAGPGADRVDGGPGADRLDGGPQADVIAGGTGRDRAVYAGRTRGVLVDLAGRDGREGEPGEGDRVLADLEDVTGGHGPDRLLGDAGPNRLDGGRGRDAVDGRGSDDRVIGGPGRDALAGNAGADVVEGGAGGDAVAGGPGRDVVRGGAGPDRLRGGAGPDRLLARDGVRGNDRLWGGAGPDTWTRDPLDRLIP